MTSASIRKSILLNDLSQKSLKSLVDTHKSHSIRTNTIIQAAIVAFSRLEKETQINVLKEVHYKDGRYA